MPGLGARAFGRSVQALEVDVGLRPTEMDFTKLSDSELKTLIGICAKALPSEAEVIR